MKNPFEIFHILMIQLGGKSGEEEENLRRILMQIFSFSYASN